MTYCTQLFILMFLMCISSIVVAQEVNENKQVDESQLSVEVLDREQWATFVEEADYFKKEKEEKVKGGKRSKEMDLGFLKYFMIGIAIAIIVFILLRVFASELFKSSKKISKKTKFKLEDIEGNLDEAPLHKPLREAIENDDYKLAIRIYYLIILQNLNQKKLINWHKEKTNTHYLNEMKNHINFREFKIVTNIFDHVWYGESTEINKETYNTLESAFCDFINQIEKV